MRLFCFFSGGVALVSTLLVGCEKSPAEPAQNLQVRETSPASPKTPPIMGKWVAENCSLVDFRSDGRCTVEPFAGNQMVGSYSWNSASGEAVLSVTTAFGTLDAIWPVKHQESDSFTADIRDEQIIGKRGPIKFVKYEDGVPDLSTEGETLHVKEGQPIELEAKFTMLNKGTGTALIKLSRTQFKILRHGDTAAYGIDFKTGPQQVGSDLSESINYAWKNGSGEVVEGRLECKVVIDAAEPTRLDLGKPVKNDPSSEWQWFRIEIPSRDGDGRTPDLYAVVSSLKNLGQFYDEKREQLGELPKGALRSFSTSEHLFWLGDATNVSLWKIYGRGEEQTLALMPSRYVVKHFERYSGARSFRQGEEFLIDSSQCPEGNGGNHQGCWAAIGFDAKAGRKYVRAFSNSARKHGWGASGWLLSENKYRQFKAANSSAGLRIYKSQLLGDWHSTLNASDVPLWTAPSDGLYWVLMHYSRKYDDSSNNCKVWVYEIPAYSNGEFTL